MDDSIENQLLSRSRILSESALGFSPILREQSVRLKTEGSKVRWTRARKSLAGGVSMVSAGPHALILFISIEVLQRRFAMSTELPILITRSPGVPIFWGMRHTR